MELTWIAIAASLLMGSGGLLAFVWAVRHKQFHSFEDVKYQVFWSDAETQLAVDPKQPAKEEQQNGSSTQAE